MSDASTGGLLAALGRLVPLALACLTLGGMILGAVIFALGDEVSEGMRDAVGIEALAEESAGVRRAVERLGQRLERTDDRIADLEDGVRRLSGADRVVEALDGTAYAEEPVHLGDRVVLRWTARRTELGASCEAIRGTPVFTGADGVPTPGRVVTPVSQWGTDFLPRRVLVEPPETLEPGRVRVLLEVRYRCGDEVVYDRLPHIVFLLLERRPGPR